MGTDLVPWLDEVEPAYDGPFAKVWRYPPRDRPAPTQVGETHLVYAPTAHPLWDWHFVAVVDLTADHPDAPPAHRRYPEAEYEILVMALAPDAPVPDPRAPLPDGSLVAMEPADAVVQFHGTGRDGALQILELAAVAIVTGQLVPDSDHREAWRRAIKFTADHIRFDGHPAT